MYNISRAFRTAEAQRVLPLLRHRFGESTVQQVAQNCASYTAAQNWQEPHPRLLYDVDPPTHESAVVKSRTQREAIVRTMRRRDTLFNNHPDALGRVQWSALHIIGSFLTFDNVGRSIHLRIQKLLELQNQSFTSRTLGCSGVLGLYNAILSHMAAYTNMGNSGSPGGAC